MAWSVHDGSARELKLRLAKYLDTRLFQKGGGRALVDKRVISQETLSHYRNWRDPDLKNAGPQKIEVFWRLCRHLGDDPGLVMFAAQSAPTEDAFWRLVLGGLNIEDLMPQPFAMAVRQPPVLRLVAG